MPCKKLLLALFIALIILLYHFGGGDKYLDIHLYQDLFERSPWNRESGDSLLIWFWAGLKRFQRAPAECLQCLDKLFTSKWSARFCVRANALKHLV